VADIKLFVCCHQPTDVPKHPLLVPIQVGAALADSHFPGFLHDDTGDNISAQNRSYCELTAQYWAWKNVNADYYGFFHYRRYLYPDMKAKRPYRIEQKVDLSLLKKLGYDEFDCLIQRYDLIVPMGENMYLPVREHYAKAPFHHGQDLDLAEEIVKKLSPEYGDAMEEYLSQTFCYFGNIFIMRREVFHHYCNWLFSVLEDFDKKADMSNYGPQEMRVDGYIAERLLGAYYIYRKKELNTVELPRVHFNVENKKRILYHLFPPGSLRRSVAKQLLVRK